MVTVAGDIKELYSFLQAIAKLCNDGDEVNGIPYQISPDDVSSYIKIKAECHDRSVFKLRLSDYYCNAPVLGLFQLLDNYKQLIRRDYAADKVLGGQLHDDKPADLDVKPVYSALNFFGENWTPPKRLEIFLKMYLAEITDLLKGVDARFPRAKGWYENEYSRLRDKSSRPPSEPEKELLTKVSKKLSSLGRGDLSTIVKGFAETAMVREEKYIPKDEDMAIAETMLFLQQPLEASVFFSVYPGAGQKNLSEPKKTMPQVGWRSKNRHVKELKSYFAGKTIKIPYHRLPYLLRYLFVRSYFRFAVQPTYSEFASWVVIHEAIHQYEITRPPPDDGNDSSSYIARFAKLSERCNSSGLCPHQTPDYASIETHMLKSILEKELEMRDLPLSEKQLLQNQQRYALLLQLKTLIREDVEYRTDNEAVGLAFRKSKLRRIRYADPFQMILNPNEDAVLSEDK
ncbi:MAG: hypothetical protein HYT75_00295 [Deltaproteobacteria bacterium]|nr:hypothetical protein [Deltaproteobacteria bacterium]